MKLKNSWKRKGITVSYNGLYQNYKYNAKSHNREFSLSIDEFKILINKNCIYCDQFPETKYNPYLKQNGDFKQSTRFMHKDYVDSLTIFFNGIDRKNSELGYNLNNTVTCCWNCNQLKKNLFSYEEFLKIGTVIKEIKNLRNKQ